MSGTPEKILEHLLEKVKLDTNGNDTIGGGPRSSPRLGRSLRRQMQVHVHENAAAQCNSLSNCVVMCNQMCDELCVCSSTDSCVGDFLLTHKIFMASSQLCPALQHQYPLMFTVIRRAGL